MKKIFAIALAIVMMMSLATTAFAANYIEKTVEDNNASTNVDVYAKYAATSDGVGVISVNIAYDSMKFVYINNADEGKWDPVTHTYVGGTVTQGWQAAEDTGAPGHHIIVTNHSNVPVWIDVGSKNDATNNANGDIQMQFASTKNTAGNAWVAEELARGEVNEPDTAPNLDVTVTVAGTIDSLVTEYVDVGDITVTIYNDEPETTNANP